MMFAAGFFSGFLAAFVAIIIMFEFVCMMEGDTE